MIGSSKQVRYLLILSLALSLLVFTVLYLLLFLC